MFDSPRVRFRILSSSRGTSPASLASSASLAGADADDASDAVDVAHAVISTAKGVERSREKIFGRKREIFLGGSRPYRAMGGQDQTGKGEKDFGKRRVEILGGKGFRGETGERILSGKGGKRS